MTRSSMVPWNGASAPINFASVATSDSIRLSLQGGGSCSTGQNCAERWCSIDSNYGMDKMTSTLSKPAIQQRGLLSQDPSNRFATWNQVLVFYCSSDEWSGRGDRIETRHFDQPGAAPDCP